MRTEPMVLACCLLALGATAAAEPAAAEPTAAEKAKAKKEYQAAQKQYDLGNFKDALAGFSEAYRLDPRPPFLFNIGQCHRMLGEHERAVFFFDRFLSFYPPGKAPNDKVVRELLAEEEAKVKAAQAPPPEAPRAEPPPPVAPPPPTLEPAPFPSGAAAAPPPPPPLVPKDEPVTTVETEGGITGKWWFWTAVGVVAAGAIAGGAIAVAKPQPRGTTLPDGDFR
mgnify:CR=1 FL=1